jgi:hypothetical protein
VVSSAIAHGRIPQTRGRARPDHDDALGPRADADIATIERSHRAHGKTDLVKT